MNSVSLASRPSSGTLHQAHLAVVEQNTVVHLCFLQRQYKIWTNFFCLLDTRLHEHSLWNKLLKMVSLSLNWNFVQHTNKKITWWFWAPTNILKRFFFLRVAVKQKLFDIRWWKTNYCAIFTVPIFNKIACFQIEVFVKGVVCQSIALNISTSNQRMTILYLLFKLKKGYKLIACNQRERVTLYILTFKANCQTVDNNQHQSMTNAAVIQKKEEMVVCFLVSMSIEAVDVIWVMRANKSINSESQKKLDEK